MKIITKTKLDALELIAKHIPDTQVCWGANSCWWCLFTDVKRTLPGGIPCGPRGSVLFQGGLADFMKAGLSKPEHYGKHGVDAFIAAYDGNLLDDDGKPTSFDSWDQYNALLDEQETDDE